MDRYLERPLQVQGQNERQMLFVSGPRQVGKTSLLQSLATAAAEAGYLNWDLPAQRALIVAGVEAVAAHCELDRLREERLFLAFDELHKYRHWRDFLKGLFDAYQDRARIMVTASAALQTFRRGGDSLMGRYFPYTLHPLSVAELTHGQVAAPGKQPPGPPDSGSWDTLWRFGGFPEPALRADTRFYRRWRRLRSEQLLREDLRDLSRIRELDQVEILAMTLAAQVGQLANMSTLAQQCAVAVDTVRRWLATLEGLFYCFSVRPWHRNVARGLRKQPKYYLWDWSLVDDPGARFENLVASALLKAVHFWSESGEGDFGLYFIRDKQGAEVDFCVTRDGRPWMLLEARSGRGSLSPALQRFREQTGAPLALQVVRDLAYVEADCFSMERPTVVPAKTFLSQLV